MIPSATDLTYFLEVAKTENVSRAAERLGISQPSLSTAIQRLEHSVGAVLFVRSKRGVVLTQAGKQLLTRSRELLHLWEHVRSGALASVNEVQGSYRIGCHPSVARKAMPLFLPQLLESHPDLDISISHDMSHRVTNDVISMRTDIGIVANPVRHPDLVIQPLYKGEMTLWYSAAKKYPLQDIQSGKAVLIYHHELLQVQNLLKVLEKKGFRFARTITSSNLEVISDLVGHGAGVGIMPAPVALRVPYKLKPVKDVPVMADDHCMIYRVENKNVRAMQVICAAIRNAFK